MIPMIPTTTTTTNNDDDELPVYWAVVDSWTLLRPRLLIILAKAKRARRMEDDVS
jgi:hypothetical protein